MSPKNILVWSFSLFSFLLVALLGFGLILPSDYKIEREIAISSSSDEVHKFVGDLSQWDKWTPWKEADPTLKITLGDQVKGVGASQSWRGKDGAGRLVFIKSDPEEGVAFEMQFNNDTNKTLGSVSYRGNNDDVIVTWTMQGGLDIPIIGPYFALMIGSNAGPMFDKGLANLKRVVENS